MEWGSRTGDRRGELLLELAASLLLCVGNVGSFPTFQGPMDEGIPDVTLYRLSGPRALIDWRVLGEVFTDSDHNYVEFRISDGVCTRPAVAEG